MLLPVISALISLLAVRASPQQRNLMPMHRNPLNSSDVPPTAAKEEAKEETLASDYDGGKDGAVVTDNDNDRRVVESWRKGIKTRIVGGGEVSPKYKLGYQAFVEPSHTATNKGLRCGGTVVHQRYVLTAAHCLFAEDDTKMNPSNWRVLVTVGEHDICDGVNEEGQKIHASEWFIHPDYQKKERGELQNDIAILKLREDIIFNSHVWPACLPAPTSLAASYSGQFVTASGWGKVGQRNWDVNPTDGTRQCQLKETTLKVQDSTNSECGIEREDPSRLCAFAPGTGTCQGDSGGPLALQGELQDGRAILLGVSSYAPGCADTRGKAAIFARVQGFLPWIATQAPDIRQCGTGDRYPWALVVSSTGPAAERQSPRMGVYRRLEGLTSNERPVWRKGDAGDYFFYHLKWWFIGPDYQRASGGISSEKKRLLEIPQTGWEYSDSGWKSDPGLIVVGDSYPLTLVVSSGGLSATPQHSRMGGYFRVDGLASNGRPVWRKGDADFPSIAGDYFFYDSNRQWIIGPDYQRAYGGILSEKTDLSEIPQTGWRYYNGQWTSDPQLTVVGTNWVRLNSYPSGRVELYKNGQWGTLCGHFWWNNQKGAENICKALGYRGGTSYTATGGSGPILAGNRLCKGGEATVWGCPLQGGRKETTDCSHAIDQGVSCT